LISEGIILSGELKLVPDMALTVEASSRADQWEWVMSGNYIFLFKVRGTPPVIFGG
jgi:hypothetical protein